MVRHAPCSTATTVGIFRRSLRERLGWHKRGGGR